MRGFFKSVCVILAVVLTVMTCVACGGAKATTFSVGMASVDITPNKDVYLEGYLKPGNPNCLAKYPDDFTDSIMARVLVLDNGDGPLVFINLEILINYVNLFSDSFKTNIANACKTTVDKVFFSNIHNHQSNSNSIDATTELKIMGAVREAYDRMTPATVGVDAAPSDFIVSRGVNLGVNLDMPVDNMLTALRFDDAKTGQPIGMVWNAPIHNTMLSNGHPENYHLLSCEVSGYACRYIEDTMSAENPDFIAMCIIGFTGNTGPNYNGSYNVANVDELKEAGAALGSECMRLYDGIGNPVNGNKINTMMGMANLPRGEDPLKEDIYGTDLLVATGSFGDVCYFGVNYEVFSVIGSRLKAEAPYSYIINAGVSLGSHAYLPTKEAFDLVPYYETTSAATCLGPDAEEIFYNTAITTICNNARVSIERVSGTAQPVASDGGVAVYGFDFADGVSPDKAVISFGQNSRNDCASDYELKLFDGSGKEVFSQTFEGLSISHVGVWTGGVKFSRAELRVSRKWQSGSFTAEGIDGLTPTVYGVSFIPFANN